MIKVTADVATLKRDLDNIVNYSLGFLDGIERGKPKLMESFAGEIKETLKEFIDASARVNPSALHHMYEWHQVGSPDARLFDIQCKITSGGISIGSTFRQSQSIREGSKVPFYNKAEIMENGIPVRITPVASQALVFDSNGETVFTRKEVLVDSPGGRETRGSFEQAFDQFFNQYFTQAFLLNSKIMYHLSVPDEFARSLGKGKKGGRAAGIAAGYRWITRAGDK